MLKGILWLVLILTVIGLALTVYGDTKQEYFPLYVGIGMGIVSSLILILTILVI
jgi:hypothetical protein